MEYIIIDTFGDNINIICKDDGSGDPIIVNSFDEAEIIKEEQTQDGIIVPLIDILLLVEKEKIYKLEKQI